MTETTAQNITRTWAEKVDAFDAKLQAYQNAGPDRFKDVTPEHFLGLVHLFEEEPVFAEEAVIDIMALALKCIAVGAHDAESIATAALQVLLIGNTEDLTISDILRDEMDDPD